MSEVFKPSSNTSEDFVKEKMNELYRKISFVLELTNTEDIENNQTVISIQSEENEKQKRNLIDVVAVVLTYFPLSFSFYFFLFFSLILILIIFASNKIRGFYLS